MLKQLLKEYEYELKASSHLGKQSQAAYLSDLKQYITYLDKKEISKPDMITKETLKQYMMVLRKRHHAPSTVSRKISALKGFHQFMVDEKILEDNVVLKLPRPKQKKHLPSVLNIKEMEALLDVVSGDTPLDQRNKAMLELLYGSGLRISELVDLNTNDLHVNEGLIHVHGKGDKTRIVPISAMAEKALKRYLESGRLAIKKMPTPVVFLNRLGRPISRVGFFKVLKDIALKARIHKNVSPHTLRHSFASHLLEAGVDLRYVQEMLGHENVSTTELYTHINKKQLIAVYDQFHPHAQRRE